MKNNYEDSIEILKKESEDLKDKIFETERIADIEPQQPQGQARGHQGVRTIPSQTMPMSNQLNLLNREIQKLQEIIENRNIELENLAKEKTQIRQTLEAEIVRAKAELEAQINENREQAR